MSNFSDFSLGLNLPIQNADEEFVRKKRALQLLNAYWVRFNVILLNVKLCENLGQDFDDVEYVGLLYNFDLIRAHVAAAEKLVEDFTTELTAEQLASPSFLQIVELVEQFKTSTLKLVVGNLYTVFDDYATAKGQLSFPKPTPEEIAQNYLPPDSWREDE